MNIEIAFGWIKNRKKLTTTLYQTLNDMAKNTTTSFEDDFGEKKLFCSYKLFVCVSFYPFHVLYKMYINVHAPYHCIMFNVNCSVCDEKQYVPNAYKYNFFATEKKTNKHTSTRTCIKIFRRILFENYIINSPFNLATMKPEKNGIHTHSLAVMCREQCVFSSVFTLTL